MTINQAYRINGISIIKIEDKSTYNALISERRIPGRVCLVLLDDGQVFDFYYKISLIFKIEVNIISGKKELYYNKGNNSFYIPISKMTNFNDINLSEFGSENEKLLTIREVYKDDGIYFVKIKDKEIFNKFVTKKSAYCNVCFVYYDYITNEPKSFIFNYNSNKFRFKIGDLSGETVLIRFTKTEYYEYYYDEIKEVIDLNLMTPYEDINPGEFVTFDDVELDKELDNISLKSKEIKGHIIDLSKFNYDLTNKAGCDFKVENGELYIKSVTLLDDSYQTLGKYIREKEEYINKLKERINLLEKINSLHEGMNNKIEKLEKEVKIYQSKETQFNESGEVIW